MPGPGGLVSHQIRFHHDASVVLAGDLGNRALFDAILQSERQYSSASLLSTCH
jgi:hypothetical protein